MLLDIKASAKCVLQMHGLCLGPDVLPTHPITLSALFSSFPPLFFTLIHSQLMLSLQLSPSFFHGSCEEAEQHLLTQGWSGAWWYQGWGTRQAREQPSPANLLVKKLCGETNLSLLTSPACRCQVLLHWFPSRLLSALGGGGVILRFPLRMGLTMNY